MARTATSRLPIAVVLAGLLCVAAALPQASAEPGGAAGSEQREVRLRLGRNGVLGIGTLPPFTYDGRAGSGVGTLTDLGGGRWAVHMPGDSVVIPPLPMVSELPELPLRVNITTKDLSGVFDSCTRQLTMDFDAAFQPEAFGQYPPALSVVTPLTTSSVSAGGQTLNGTPVDADGRVTLVGVAAVPPTGDLFVDALLGLPSNATAVLAADLDVVGGLPTCPGSDLPDPHMTLEVGADSRLWIGGVGPLALDGGNIAHPSDLVPLGGGRYSFVVPRDAVQIPAVALFPFGIARVDVVPAVGLSGTIDVCSGEMELTMAADFVADVAGWRSPPLSVMATLTTTTSSAGGRSITGESLDEMGSARLVAVTTVERSGDWLVDLLLGLPGPAVADLDVHLDLRGTHCG